MEETKKAKDYFAILQARGDKRNRTKKRSNNPIVRRTWGLIRGARARARERGLPCDISTEWALPIIQAGICQATGMKLDIHSKRGPFSPSIDRIVPSKGYTTANCQIVVLIHNQIRHNWGDDPVIEYCKHIASVLQ